MSNKVMGAKEDYPLPKGGGKMPTTTSAMSPPSSMPIESNTIEGLRPPKENAQMYATLEGLGARPKLTPSILTSSPNQVLSAKTDSKGGK